MVGVDSTFLSLMLHPKARPPLDPATKKPIEKMEQRIEALLERLAEDGEAIIVPTPVLSEFLILAGRDGPKYLALIETTKTILVVPFDQKAAVELAAIESSHRSAGSKKGGSASPYQKVKLDRQIVATVKAHTGHTIYADDTDIRNFALRAGIKVVSTWELPIPPSPHPLLDDSGGPLDI